MKTGGWKRGEKTSLELTAVSERSPKLQKGKGRCVAVNTGGKEPAITTKGVSILCIRGSAKRGTTGRKEARDHDHLTLMGGDVFETRWRESERLGLLRRKGIPFSREG